MKVKELTVTMGRTLQVKQYEPINVQYSCKVEVDIDGQNMGVLEKKVEEEYRKIESLVQRTLTKKVQFFEKLIKPTA